MFSHLGWALSIHDLTGKISERHGSCKVTCNVRTTCTQRTQRQRVDGKWFNVELKGKNTKIYAVYKNTVYIIKGYVTKRKKNEHFINPRVERSLWKWHFMAVGGRRHWFFIKSVGFKTLPLVGPETYEERGVPVHLCFLIYCTRPLLRHIAG